MRRFTAAAFAPEALRRASPKLGENHAERRREHAENSWRFLLGGYGFFKAVQIYALQARATDLHRVLLRVPCVSMAAVEVVPLHRPLGGAAGAQLAMLHGNHLGENAHGNFLRRDGADVESDRRV